MFLGFLSAIPILHNWRIFAAFIAILTIVPTLTSFSNSKSAEWLFATGKHELAVEICNDLSIRKDGKPVPTDILEQAKIDDTETTPEQKSIKYTGM